MTGIELYTYFEAGDGMMARNVLFCAGRKGDVISTTEPLMLMIHVLEVWHIWLIHVVTMMLCMCLDTLSPL